MSGGHWIPTFPHPLVYFACFRALGTIGYSHFHTSLVHFACFCALENHWTLTCSHPSRLLCLLLYVGKLLDTNMFIPISSTLLAFVLWDSIGYEPFHIPLVYFACFCVFGEPLGINVFIPLSSTLLAFVLWEAIGC